MKFNYTILYILLITMSVLKSVERGGGTKDQDIGCNLVFRGFCRAIIQYNILSCHYSFFFFWLWIIMRMMIAFTVSVISSWTGDAPPPPRLNSPQGSTMGLSSSIIKSSRCLVPVLTGDYCKLDILMLTLFHPMLSTIFATNLK